MTPLYENDYLREVFGETLDRNRPDVSYLKTPKWPVIQEFAQGLDLLVREQPVLVMPLIHSLKAAFAYSNPATTKFFRTFFSHKRGTALYAKMGIEKTPLKQGLLEALVVDGDIRTPVKTGFNYNGLIPTTLMHRGEYVDFLNEKFEYLGYFKGFHHVRPTFTLQDHF